MSEPLIYPIPIYMSNQSSYSTDEDYIAVNIDNDTDTVESNIRERYSPLYVFCLFFAILIFLGIMFGISFFTLQNFIPNPQ